MRSITPEVTLFTDRTTTGTSTVTLNCSDYRNQVFMIGGTDTPTANVKIKGSNSDTCPDFSATATPTNAWDYLNTVNLQSKTSVSGDTGITVVAGVEQVEANENVMRWMTAEVSAISAGKVTVRAVQSTNE